MDSERMESTATLRERLRRMDGRGYPAYKGLRGGYRLERCALFVDHVQGDPFAAPSRLRARVGLTASGLAEAGLESRSRRVALRDFLARRFAEACADTSGRRGSGTSGLVEMARPGQEILERSSVVLGDDFVEARFVAGLPAAGRRILAREADALLTESIPSVVDHSLFLSALDREALRLHLDTSEDADVLREVLAKRGLVAFVADGAVLPRRSGVDPRALDEGAVPFASPGSLRVSIDLPHAGRINGMGLPQGITVIAGGGFHGKSTLLAALEHGIYNHIPGDGRELVVTDAAALKIRAEDGRAVRGVDLRPFIGDLPGGRTTRAFSTENASGSTSQAANILEGIEAGARVLLLDEDTCATNLMIRDARMQALVRGRAEPITPFIERARHLADAQGISSVLVSGGCGDYLEIADLVLRMDNYHCADATEEARDIVRALPTARSGGDAAPWPQNPPTRRVDARSLDPSKGRRDVRVRARATRAIEFGHAEIDLSAVSQIVDPGQARAIGDALLLLRDFAEDARDEDDLRIPRLVRDVAALIDREGLSVLDVPHPSGDWVAFRTLELAAALNRLRSLRLLP
ncbi:MAG: ABC-ATPase domain-containing protein [Opitutales bacterium]|nr:ABC-ATPase domain-containing protein [Opitutales bacterium]